MKVRDVMESRVVAVLETDTYREAAATMHRHGFSGLPVVDARGCLTGVLTESDLFCAMYPSPEEFFSNPELFADREERESEVTSICQNPVRQHMTRDPITIPPDAPVLRAGGFMLAHHIHRLPVVEDGQLVGIVTRGRIFGALLERYLGIHDSIVVEHIAQNQPASSKIFQGTTAEDITKRLEDS